MKAVFSKKNVILYLFGLIIIFLITLITFYFYDDEEMSYIQWLKVLIIESAIWIELVPYLISVIVTVLYAYKSKVYFDDEKLYVYTWRIKGGYNFKCPLADAECSVYKIRLRKFLLVKYEDKNYLICGIKNLNEFVEKFNNNKEENNG